jgi:putative sterol carrier protein
VTVEETLASVVERFNRHSDRNPATRQELDGIARTIQIHLTDGGTYAVDLAKGHLGNLRSGQVPTADLRITTDVATFHSLVAKEIGPMKALVTRRLTISGSLEDKLLFRKLL